MSNISNQAGPVVRVASIENNEDGQPRVRLELRSYAGSYIWMEADTGNHTNAYGANVAEAVEALENVYQAAVWGLQMGAKA